MTREAEGLAALTLLSSTASITPTSTSGSSSQASIAEGQPALHPLPTRTPGKDDGKPETVERAEGVTE